VALVVVVMVGPMEHWHLLVQQIQAAVEVAAHQVQDLQRLVQAALAQSSLKYQATAQPHFLLV
jgi:hypothetical protein